MEELNLNIISEKIESKIYLLRGKKVMLDRDLAELYGVETKYLKRQVNRNIDRFPDDFMFEMTEEELEDWRRQFGTSNSIKMGLRYRPLVFTEFGVSMLSSVLNCKRAIQVNIQIMRILGMLREMVHSHKALLEEIRRVERKGDINFKIVFEAIRKLQQVELKPKMKIGFGANEK